MAKLTERPAMTIAVDRGRLSQNTTTFCDRNDMSGINLVLMGVAVSLETMGVDNMIILQENLS